MGLFKKKIDILYIPVFKTKSLREQYDKLKEAYETLEEKYDNVIRRNLNDDYDYIQTKKTVNQQREFILQLQNKIYALQEELIAKNKIIQGMDKGGKNND